eukprot:330690-Chlamydomonas_euryale.AAC.4
MEPSALGIDPLLASWLATLPPGVSEHAATLSAIFNATVPEALRFLRRGVKETVTTVNPNLVASCFNLMDALILAWRRPDGGPALSADERNALGAMLPSLMLFSVVWSLGASCDKAGRQAFDEFFKRCVADAGLGLPDGAMFPAELSVYEWCYDQSEAKWVEWMDTVPEFKCDPDRPFSQIIVPTADTVRYTYLVDRLLACGKHVLCVGETGTGKTLNVANKLMNDMPADVLPVFMTFSARTSANMTQDIIDAKMDKRRKGVFGPPAGKRYVVFVDDLNMPQREKYFAQPPIELLRQWFDHGGWYDRKPPCAFRSIVDTQFVGSMGPPGGGRNPVTNRLLRHFNFISFTEMSDASLQRIFSTILGAFFKKHFSDAVQGTAEGVVASTVQLYNRIREELLPTPAKSHYTFNLRDLARVVQGMMQGDARSVTTPPALLALWLHECSRVFEDRLINDADHEWFRAQQGALLEDAFSLKYDDVVTADRLVFGDFLVPGADPRVYAQITDMGKLVKVRGGSTRSRAHDGVSWGTPSREGGGGFERAHCCLSTTPWPSTRPSPAFSGLSPPPSLSPPPASCAPMGG